MMMTSLIDHGPPACNQHITSCVKARMTSMIMLMIDEEFDIKSMDLWVDGWVDLWADGQVDGWMKGLMDRWMGGFMG